MRRRSIRVTFVIPFLRPTSGGAYIIEQFARHLAPRMRVRLLSKTPVSLRSRVSHRFDGVRTSLLPSELPAADVLILPADDPDGQRFMSLPASRGVPVLFFQGFGGQAAHVRENLAHASRAITVSRFLEREGQRLGCRTRYASPGLDRSIFHPGAASELRPPTVSMLTHSNELKGTEEGLAALRAVRDEVPGVQFRLFGPHVPDMPGAVRSLRPNRREVAAILRDSAVFVCSSREEGLGLPGIEALACGAALATTDTGGSRDYAEHEQTALVSPPRDSGRLAENVTRLLRDVDLRVRLTRAGGRGVTERYPDWPAAAGAFDEALTALL
jgi:glycosyltransferase involved in cell wall biosynthesis